MEDDIETPPSTSPAPSRPNSTRGAKAARYKFPNREVHWKYIGMITGFLFAALLSALGHYRLVRYLDGKLTDEVYLTQSEVSAISILFTTLFKAALTASIGTCFAQHLWFVLSEKATSLSTIDKLFALRTNILALCHLRSILRAPLLFLMALLVWCLGFATIYPPGALIVTFEANTFTENYNMSVMNPPIPQNLDLAANDTFPTLSDDPLITLEADNQGPRSRQFWYKAPKQSLVNIAQSIITNNQVFRLLVQPGENSTFRLQFRAPQYKCTVSRYNGSIPLEYRTQGNTDETDDALTGLVFVSEWNAISHLYSVIQHRIGNYTVQRSQQNTTSYEAFVETTEQSCHPTSVLYAVEVTFPRGIQTIQHSLSDARSLPKQKDLYDGLQGSLGISLVLPPESQALEEWRQKMLTALPISNEWALLDALGSSLEGSFYEDSPRPYPDECRKRQNSKNDTDISDCWGWGSIKPYNPANNSDPSTALNITEGLLNGVLTKITLSALSLGTWWDMVPVATTRYLIIYSFAKPNNLILPYSIFLAAATIFAVIAIWSLWQNGIPAADGGFFISKELKSLEIRYGELAIEEVLEIEERKLGFGTVEETVSFRRGRRRFE
ncbi:hypothetical protein HBI70_071390 [Parastagonospora nodorum]|nr:hypothetical protein HBI04_108760 [Parastagonospora nodorum]KAH4608302.1 hypothetical protein HBH82_074050 [Parastagonospora nodorum]KAH4689431.1 hypothetical protein HBH78_094070 [Parastagonospora nodorum]KAH5281191.1 hypothetical protein HBI70_071390 [Parastagonospora nodorum]KAH5320158.1 hypothetical protein HBI50_112010 [Parastagonospora nodorum]